MLPNPWILLGGVVALIAALTCAFLEGRHYETLQYEAAASAAKDQVLEKVQLSDAIGVKAEAQVIQATAQIRTLSLTQIEEVPKYVPVEADRACTINVGFVQLHDAAAAGLPLPAAPAGGIGGAAAGVDLAAVGTTVVTNYAAANENAARLKAVQAYYEAQRTLGN